MYAEYLGKELTVTNKMVMALRLQMITGGLFPYSTTEIVIGRDGEEVFDTTSHYKLIEDGIKIKVLLEDIHYEVRVSHILINYF